MNTTAVRRACVLAAAFVMCGVAWAETPTDIETALRPWTAELDSVRGALKETGAESRPQAALEAVRRLNGVDAVLTDWLLQDGLAVLGWKDVPAGGRQDFRMAAELVGGQLAELLARNGAAHWRSMARRAIRELRENGGAPPGLAEAAAAEESLSRETWADLYFRACEERRARRLEPLLRTGWEGVVFACHFNMGASHYAYTEGLSDAQNERHFYPGSALRVLRPAGTRFTADTLLEDAEGVIRDVDVSWDGGRVLFAWKRSDREDDYSPYEMDARTGALRAVTGAPGHADYEPAYLPNGDIVFNSTRCVQIVDCWWTEVSNLYACDPGGRYLRRLTFDQVHTNYPAVTGDGRVLYCRWDYNDRGQIYPQGLFEMLPDGTAQQEFYGNNSWFPTTILHARSIPGTSKVLAIFTGHHTWQAGKVGVLDPALGRQENTGAQLVAPVRRTPAQRIDSYGQEGGLFKYPYPVDERHFLVSHAPLGWEGRGAWTQARQPVFGLYFMDMDGRRELLYLDTTTHMPVGRMVPLAAREKPGVRAGSVDYRKETGVCYVQDVYAGEALRGVPRGTVKALRVVVLDYRAAGIGNNRNEGVAGAALVSTPVAISDGCWDVKIPLGRATVYEDGSALFFVPARTPVYFQALDGNGHAIQTMRSWATLQPGEHRSCVGCHDNRSAAPPAERRATLAMRAGTQDLQPVYGPPRGFSFSERVQPILDRHCVRCHRGSEAGAGEGPQPLETAFSLLGTPREDAEAKRFWTDAYLNLTRGGPGDGPVRWTSPQSAPPMQEPYAAGAARSPLLAMLAAGHHEAAPSPEEMDTLACWVDLGVPFCGDYTEAGAWSEEERARYAHFLRKRREMQAVEADHIQAYIRDRQFPR